MNRRISTGVCGKSHREALCRPTAGVLLLVMGLATATGVMAQGGQGANGPAPAAARDSGSSRHLQMRADPPPPPAPAQPSGYPSGNSGQVIITAPAPTQSFAGSGTSLPAR